MMIIVTISDEMNDYWEKFIRISKSSVDFNFRTWFVGFIEGFDNKAFVRKGFDSVYFELKLPIFEVEVINYILENFKPLNIEINLIATKKFICLKIVDKQSLLKLISLFSGSIFLREYFNRFRFWIAVFRYLHDIHIIFLKKTIQNMPFYSNMWITQTSWLSGLLDARSFFTKLSYHRSFNQFEDSEIKGQFLLPMKVSREIKLFEVLAKNYGGKLKIFEFNKSRKFYYCIDIAFAREFSFYVFKNFPKTQRAKLFTLFFKIMLEKESLDKKAFGFNYVTNQLKENNLNTFVNLFNYELDQNKFSFRGQLNDVWQSMFFLRAEKRAKSKGGQYANFLENKYKHVFQLKPKSLQIDVSKSKLILFVRNFLHRFKPFICFRKGHFRSSFFIPSNIKQTLYSCLIIDVSKPYQLSPLTRYVYYLIDPKRTVSNFKTTLRDNFGALQARREFFFIMRYYDTVVDCEFC